MDSGLFAAVNGALRTEMRLEVLANNLANVSTTGYKEGAITFDSFMTTPGKEQFPLPTDSFMGIKGPGDIPFPFSNPATNAYSVTYPRADGTHTDLTQGVIKKTDNPLDVAIEGAGFFVIQTPEGRRYTRDGAFQVNDAGELVTQDGFSVRGAGNTALVVGSDGKISIALDGTLSNREGPFGQLMRVDIPPEVLKRTGSNRFSAPQDREVNLQNAPGGFHYGFLESSNVNVMRGMSQMIEANRAFETYMRAIRSLDGLDGQAIEIGKLNG